MSETFLKKANKWNCLNLIQNVIKGKKNWENIRNPTSSINPAIDWDCNNKISNCGIYKKKINYLLIN